jgi:hypothetical protein
VTGACRTPKAEQLGLLQIAPKVEATRSNRVGCANKFHRLRGFRPTRKNQNSPQTHQENSGLSALSAVVAYEIETSQAKDPYRFTYHRLKPERPGLSPIQVATQLVRLLDFGRPTDAISRFGDTQWLGSFLVALERDTARPNNANLEPAACFVEQRLNSYSELQSLVLSDGSSISLSSISLPLPPRLVPVAQERR